MAQFIYRHRRGTTEKWQAATSIIPYDGELIIEECADGTVAIKVGDGTHTFNDLPYVSKDEIAKSDLAQALKDEIDGKATKKYVDDAIAKIPVPDVGDQISKHDTSSTAHSDIRTVIGKKLDASAVTGDLLTHNASEFAKAEHDHAIADVTGLQSELDGKQAKGNYVTAVTGKGLSTNDFTTAEKEKLAGIAIGANNYTYTLPAAGTDLGGVKTGGGVTINAGVITVGEDSHIHTFATVTGLQAALDGKQAKGSYATADHKHDGVYQPVGDYSEEGHKHTKSEITDFPTLATVATSGKYSDLTGKPVNATTDADGLMSKTDKSNLDTIVNSFKNDDSNTTIDTIKEVLKAFENAPEGTNIANALAGKVDKVSGKGLSTNDFTTAEKEKLAGIASGANAYTLPAAGTSLGGVKSGGDVTITDGVITVSDDSHNHTIANVDGLQSALDGKQAAGSYAAASHAHGNINNSGQITATESTTSNVKHIAVCVDDNGTVKKMAPADVRTAIGAGTSNLTLAGNGSETTAAKSDHTHNYAGSSSAGGSATSAVKLDTATAGSATQPVYFTGGKPTACTYTLEKSVPSDAKFTDTTYTFETGAANGQIKVTPSGGSAQNIAVKGLGSAAYTDSSAYMAAGDTSHGTHVSYGGNGSATTVSRSDHTHSYLPLAGGTMTDGGSITLSTYGTRKVVLTGNSISADMSKETGGWAGNFASVKDPAGDTTAMLGWYGGNTLTHIYMGGTYSDPYMKMTKAGQFTFKNTPKVGSVDVALTSDLPTFTYNSTTKTLTIS